MSRKNLTPAEVRAREFAEIGANKAVSIGVVNVTRKMISDEAGVSGPLVARYLGNKEEMQKNIKSAMRRLKLSEPSKAEILAAGLELRKKPRKVAEPKAVKTKAVKKAPANKAVKKAPANKAVKKAPANKFGAPKLPPLPTP